MHRHIASAVLAIAVLGVSAGLHAQSYPSKPIRVIIPFPAGGGPDVVMRRVGFDLQPRLGHGFVIENRAGGNFVPGAEACARATPDGYTLCYINSTQTSVNPHVMSKLPYDWEKDFKPVTNLYTLVSGLFVSAATPVNSMKEFEAWTKARPGAVNMSSHGPNTPTDIYRRWLNERWGTDMVGIGYKDGNAMIAALMAGDIHFTWIGYFNALGPLGSKKVKMLAISSAKRYPGFPDVQTFTEAGIIDPPMTPWQGLAFPGGTPDGPVRRINAEVIKLFGEPEFVKFMVTQGLDSLVGTPEEFLAYMRRDRDVAGEIIKRFNIPRQ
jgi:tripartite-type tricarboxylate transporter receptor subunit TctC